MLYSSTEMERGDIRSRKTIQVIDIPSSQKYIDGILAEATDVSDLIGGAYQIAEQKGSQLLISSLALSETFHRNTAVLANESGPNVSGLP